MLTLIHFRDRFVGRRAAMIRAAVQARLGRRGDEDVPGVCRAASEEMVQAHLSAVQGVAGALLERYTLTRGEVARWAMIGQGQGRGTGLEKVRLIGSGMLQL